MEAMLKKDEIGLTKLTEGGQGNPEHEPLHINAVSNRSKPTELLQAFFTGAFDRVYYTSELRAQEEYAKEYTTEQGVALINREQLTFKTTPTRRRIMRFFGFSSTDPIAILGDLTGWTYLTQKQYSTSLKLLLAPFIFSANLLLTASQLALNIVKLGTEFLPYILAKSSWPLFTFCMDGLTGDSFKAGPKDGIPVFLLLGLIKFGFLLGFLLSGAITAAYHIGYFIGGATTSPTENFRAALNAGRELAGGDVNPKTSKLLGGIFAVVSALTSACVYAVLFPVLLTQAPAVLPAIANGISQFIGIFGAQTGASAAAFFTTTLPTALASIGATISSLVEPLLMGVAACVAIGVGVIIPAVVAIDQAGKIKNDDPNAPLYHATRMGVLEDYSPHQWSALSKTLKAQRDIINDGTLHPLLSNNVGHKPYYKPLLPNLPKLPSVTELFFPDNKKGNSIEL